MSIFSDISENLRLGKVKAVKELVSSAIADHIPARDILELGLLDGMNIVGVKFKNNEIYIPEVMISARAMAAGTELLRPLFAGEGIKSAGKVCLGTVRGDMHDIGKNLVKIMMEGKGLEVIDLGTNVLPQNFIDSAIKEDCRVIACSALLTTTMGMMREVVDLAAAAGIRDRVKIMVGGAPVTSEFCRSIGADLYTSNAAAAAEAALAFCQKINI